MKKTISTKDLNCYETRFYLIPKDKILLAYRENINNAIKNIEDFELYELTENEITDKIDQYNLEKGNNFFERLKQKDFLLVTAHIQKIGKYKFAKINLMDNM